MRVPPPVGATLDGNRHRASGCGLPRQDGHRRGIDSGRSPYRRRVERGIPQVSIDDVALDG